MSKATDFEFGVQVHVDNFSKMDKQNFRIWAWTGSGDPYKIWQSLKYISKMSKATDLKFGTRKHLNNFSKMDK